jgi:hypothetical protein
MASRAALVLVSVAAFVATAWALGRLPAWPEDLGMRARWAWLVEHGAEYDTLVLGSSATANGFVPAAFDEACRAEGLEVRSFNFGVEGMDPFEADHTLRALLAEGLLPNLRFVLIEGNDWSPRIQYPDDERQLWRNERFVFAHDLPATREAVAWTREHLDGDLARRQVEQHLELAARRAANLGAGPSLVGSLLRTWEGSPTREQLAVDHGFVALEELEDRPDVTERRARFEEGLATYLEQIQAWRTQLEAEGPQASPPSPEYRAALTRQRALLEERGVRAVHFTGTRTIRTPGLLGLAAEGALDLLPFNDPSAFPALYAPEARFDREHLNRAGATKWSSLLGRAFARRVAP